MDLVHKLSEVKDSLPKDVTLVAVSKTKPSSMIKELHDAGHVDFGENKVQDLVAKYEELPKDIRWHMIGHLQSNKVKYIAPFVHLIHGVDSFKLLKLIDKEGKKNNRVINCLLQIHIAEETTKFGLNEEDLKNLLTSEDYHAMEHVAVNGLMGMATFSDNSDALRREFRNLKRIFEEVKDLHFSTDPVFSTLSIGMSDDYHLAIEEGSTMVRVGSAIFGPRNYS